MSFKNFLINEDKYYLGQRAGDVLTALQSLEEDAPNMGSRAMIRASQGVADQIRRILHGRWDEDEVKYLKRLQKVGVAILRGIDSNEDMGQIVASCNQEIQEMLGDLETPVNALGSERQEPSAEDDGPMTGEQISA